MSPISLRLEQSKICSICRQAIGNEVLTKLVGWAGYDICPSCGQKVFDHRDRNYRARARRWRRRLSKDKPPTPVQPVQRDAEETFEKTWMRAHERVFHI